MPPWRHDDMRFAPAFKPKAKHDTHDETEEVESFAPAFRQKSKICDGYDASGNPQYEYMKKEYGQSNTWNTYDISTKRKNYSSSGYSEGSHSAQAEPDGVWNNWGVKVEDGCLQDVTNLFVKDNEVMSHDAPRNAFEAANMSTLGRGSKSKTIVNMIGDRVIGTVNRSTEERLRYLDEKGKYSDGQDRGMIPKRLLEEHARRIRQWRDEMTHANAVLKEWNHLAPEQQTQRRENARLNMSEMLQALELIVDEDVPEEYLRKDQDTSQAVDLVEEDELPLFVGDSDDEEPSTTSHTSSSRPPSKRVFSGVSNRQSHMNRGAENRRNALERGSDQRGSSYKTLSECSRRPPRHQRVGPLSKASKDYHRRELRITAQLASQPGLAYRLKSALAPTPAPKSVVSESSLFSVTSFPDALPLEDTDALPTHAVPRAAAAKYSKAVQHATIFPRIVAIQLHSNLNFNPEAVVARVFGGHVQEIQFFPKARQALVAFLYPWEATAFIVHNRTARKYDEEFRRLQIAAHWYHGKEEEAIYGQQMNLIKHVMNENASRIVQVAGIDKRIDHAMLTEVLKGHFPNLVKLRLVIPKKRYEREKQNSNSIILEFSNIPHAISAHRAFASNSLRDFPNATPTYLIDPCAEPRPRQPWCDCLHCKAPLPTAPMLRYGSSTPGGSDTASDTGDGDLVMPFHRGRVVNSWGRNAGYFATWGDVDLEFDPEFDASRPAEFARSWDGRY